MYVLLMVEGARVCGREWPMEGAWVPEQLTELRRVIATRQHWLFAASLGVQGIDHRGLVTRITASRAQNPNTV